MSRSLKHHVSKLDTSCDFEVNSTLISSHNMPEDARDRIQNMIEKYNLSGDNLLSIQGAQRNRQYIRILLPKNARISK